MTWQKIGSIIFLYLLQVKSEVLIIREIIYQYIIYELLTSVAMLWSVNIKRRGACSTWTVILVVTSLAAWLIIKYTEEDWHVPIEEDSDNEDDVNSCKRQEYNCGLGNHDTVKQEASSGMHERVSCYMGSFLFGSDQFKQLVYNPEYRVKVLQHISIANLPGKPESSMPQYFSFLS